MHASLKKVVSRKTRLKFFEASEARILERSIRVSSHLTANVWASGPIVIPIKFAIFKMSIKPLLKILTARKVTISTVAFLYECVSEQKSISKNLTIRYYSEFQNPNIVLIRYLQTNFYKLVL